MYFPVAIRQPLEEPCVIGTNFHFGECFFFNQMCNFLNVTSLCPRQCILATNAAVMKFKFYINNTETAVYFFLRKENKTSQSSLSIRYDRIRVSCDPYVITRESNSVFIREYTSYRKSVFWNILHKGQQENTFD